MRVLLVLVATLCPLVSLILALPILLAGSQSDYSNLRFQIFYWSLATVVSAGILAAPGYLVVLFHGARARLVPTRWRTLLRLSLILGAVAAVVGIGLTVLAFWWLALFPLVTFALCLWLLRFCRFDDNDGSAQDPGPPKVGLTS
jgi:hypothetical protein